jgi:hypothetical protein
MDRTKKKPKPFRGKPNKPQFKAKPKKSDRELLEIEKLKVEIAKYKEKEAATKKRQGMNSRGRPKR